MGPSRYQIRGGSNLLNPDQCEQEYNHIFEMYDGNVCARQDESGECDVNVGGALLVSEGRNSEITEDSVPWYLIGVFNFGGRDCSKPSIYTRISYFTGWIRHNLRP